MTENTAEERDTGAPNGRIAASLGRSMPYAVGICGALWIGSWYLMYLEVTRWHHVKPSLAFNSDIAPGAHPGQALILLYIACVAAPLAAVICASCWTDPPQKPLVFAHLAPPRGWRTESI